jgi:predicted RNA binding protein YcfA (HicA-like mRNA interferase family)
MSNWPSTRARRVLAALLRIGWQVKRQSGSHRTLSRAGWPDYVFAFLDNEEIGPRI